MSLSVNELQDLLPLYYKRLFPFGPFYKWLTYGAANSNYFSNREFSLTLNNDVYIRYQSYDNQDELEKEIKKHCPCKIDIGAVYTTRPRDNRMLNIFSPVEKELVFDVDMTDYDDVRTCCSGAEICNKCWKFLAIACKVINEALLQDFGWKHLLWVFSGRRGIHCWVCDESARKLDSSSRSAVAEYLQIITGGQNQSKKVSLQGDILHPLVSRSLKMLEKYFVDICVVEQDILGTQELCDKFLLLINEMDLRENVKCKFASCTNSWDRWNAFVNLVDTNQGQMGRNRKNKYLVEEVILQYAYPRLDINVTKGINHLLKSPFCIHPKTGKVCVPFSCRIVDNFDPNNVPTITSLINEINKYDREIQEFNSKSDVNVKDYKKTSLNKYMHVFHEFLSQLQESSRESRLRNSGSLQVVALDICENNGRVINVHPGYVGLISSIQPPLNGTWKCGTELISCPTCKIHFNIESVNIPLGCDDCECGKLVIGEPINRKVQRWQYCVNQSQVEYISKTNTLNVLFTFKRLPTFIFTLKFSAKYNVEYIYGTPDVNNTGVITSAFFSDPYPPDLRSHKVIKCRYHLNCRIVITFTDFLLHSNSFIQVFDGPKRLFMLHGNIFRPDIIVSSTPSISLRFYGNRATNIGYKAQYTIIHDGTMITKPRTDCGGFVNGTGGVITMINITQQESFQMFDCIWIIPSLHQLMKNHLHIHIELQSISGSELKIHNGLTSDKKIIEHIKCTKDEYKVIKMNGTFAPIYISFRGALNLYSRLQIIYASFTISSSYMMFDDRPSCPLLSDFHCGNNRCIDSKLRCDGLDHCADTTDEQYCNRVLSYTNTANFYFPNSNSTKMMNNFRVQATYASISIISICIVFYVILMSIRYITKYRTIIIQTNGHQQQSHAQFSLEMIHLHDDDPPSYEQATRLLPISKEPVESDSESAIFFSCCNIADIEPHLDDSVDV